MRTPVGRVARYAFQRAYDDRLDHLIRDRSGSTGLGFIVQPLEPAFDEPTPPLANRCLINAEIVGNLFVPGPRGARQNNARALPKRLSRRPPRGEA